MEGDPEQRDDATLVLLARDGHREAFATLIERHGRAVRTTVNGHVRDPDAADDTVQETFTRAFDRLHTLRSPDRFRPWILQIARNASADVRRRRNQVVFETIDESGDDGVVPVDDAAGPDAVNEVRELVERVRHGVAGLSPRDATALSMVLWFGFGPTEVGAALGISPTAAKVMLHRARQRLRDALVAEVVGAGVCPEVDVLVDADDSDAVVRHARTCERCVDAAREHLDL